MNVMAAVREAQSDIEKTLAAEVQRLRIELNDANGTIRALEESINDKSPSWMQSKNMAQRKVLRTLNNRVRAQRIVLRLSNRLGVVPTREDLNTEFARVAETERLAESEVNEAIAFLHQ